MQMLYGTAINRTICIWYTLIMYVQAAGGEGRQEQGGEVSFVELELELELEHRAEAPPEVGMEPSIPATASRNEPTHARTRT